MDILEKQKPILLVKRGEIIAAVIIQVFSGLKHTSFFFFLIPAHLSPCVLLLSLFQNQNNENIGSHSDKGKRSYGDYVG